MSPLKSVRKYCLWCCNDSEKEVRLCPSVNCPLYPLRFGKKGKGYKTLQQIKKRCKDCAEITSRKCEMTDCHLYPYRTGNNPKRAGIGRKEGVVPRKGS